jgi:hypothetical protein
VRTSGTVQNLLRMWLKFSEANRFDDATWEPAAAQERVLLAMVRRNQDTVYGREHGFNKIRSIRDYQARVPKNSYDDLMPYISRVLRGEQNILTDDKPAMFATTSGTTGATKYIPVTPSYMHEYGHGVHVHTYRVFADFHDILEGKVLVSSSSDVEGYSEGGTPYGAISGYVTRTQPASIKRFYVLPYDICRVKQVDQKYYLTLRYGLAADVRLIATPNPSSLLLMADKMNAFADELIHDIRRGTVNPKYLPADATPKLKAGPGADAKRANELAAILRREGRLLPRDVWPNLRVISCWKGGTMPLYLRKLPEVFGDAAIRDLGYMASEGRGATPLVNAGAAGVLNLTSHFFEFLPEEQRDDPNPEFLTADQLESNREYYIYFTTSGGLYRYDINDVIRVVDFYRNTPVIQFVRKGQGMTSITGEKLAESQVTAALLYVVPSEGLHLDHFTAAVEWGEPPRYSLYVEVPSATTRTQLERFGSRMDQALCSLNSEYAAKRESQRLGAPVVRRVAPGSYEALRQRRVSEGAPEAQVKIPHLSTNMKFGDQFQVLEEVRSDTGVAVAS